MLERLQVLQKTDLCPAPSIPGWKQTVTFPCDKDDEINFKNFSEALAVMHGSLVSTELSQLLGRI